jgi:hypothetical protein
MFHASCEPHACALRVVPLQVVGRPVVGSKMMMCFPSAVRRPAPQALSNISHTEHISCRVGSNLSSSGALCRSPMVLRRRETRPAKMHYSDRCLAPLSGSGGRVLDQARGFFCQVGNLTSGANKKIQTRERERWRGSMGGSHPRCETKFSRCLWQVRSGTSRGLGRAFKPLVRQGANSRISGY